MTRQKLRSPFGHGPVEVDCLVIPYFADLSAWEQASPAAHIGPASDPKYATYNSPNHLELAPRIDGKLYDLPRFLASIRDGNSCNYREFDPFNANPLVGSYLISILGAQGYDARHGTYTDQQILESLARQIHPRFVLVSTSLMGSIEIVAKVCRLVRALWPDALVLVGGLILIELYLSHERKLFVDVLKRLDADACIVSAGAEAELLRLLKTDPGCWPLQVPPTVWIRQGPCFAPGRGATLPPNSIDRGVRWSRLEPNGTYPVVHLRTARSCAFKCAFCSYPANQGPLTLRDLDAFDAELDELEALGTVRSLIFTDDTFNVPVSRFREICRRLTRRSFSWYSFFRPQYCDHQLALLMKDAGCKGVFLGIESVDDRVLRNMNKRATRAQYETGIGALKRVGIYCHASFIFGFPGDKPENMSKTARFVDETGIDSFATWPFFLSPATPVYEQRDALVLTGRYYDWHHPGMDAATAKGLVRAIRSETRHGAYFDDLCANGFWGAIMLLSNGWSNSEVRAAGRAYTRRMGGDTDWHTLICMPDVLALQMTLRRRPMELPPAEGLRFLDAGRDQSSDCDDVCLAG